MAVTGGAGHDADRGRSPFVVLGVSAGIAAYKAVEVCRQLVDAGIHVAPVLTERATRFVGRATFDALGSEPTQVSLWDEDSAIPHTRLGQRADLIVVAPATADLLARYAGGLADDLLTATLIATAAPVVVCPAMHTEMWEHPSVQENLATLRSRGVTVVPPEQGRLAGGDIGAGRLADPSVIVGTVLDVLALPGRDSSVERVETGVPCPGSTLETWPGYTWWCPPAAPGSRSIRSGSSPIDPRESRATPWPMPHAGEAPRSCWSPRAPDRWDPVWPSTGWRRPRTWRPPCSGTPDRPTWSSWRPQWPTSGPSWPRDPSCTNRTVSPS